eukprot:COSAG01_NODE_9007_length_2584_cov_3.857545_1_plen_22_part_10
MDIETEERAKDGRVLEGAATKK